MVWLIILLTFEMDYFYILIWTNMLLGIQFYIYVWFCANMLLFI